MTRSSMVVPLASRVTAVVIVATVVVAGCSGAAATVKPSSATASRAPSLAPSASTRPSASTSAEPSASGAGVASAQPSIVAGSGLQLPVADPAPALKIAEVAGIGKVLADEHGMVLYTDAQDPTDSSACIETCATTWHPFAVEPGATVPAASGISGVVGTITRPDGTSQLTYDGHPLYFYHYDPKPGTAKGVGIDPDWTVATP